MVSIEFEIPDALWAEMQLFLESHSDWNQDRLGAAALSLMLLQQGKAPRVISQIYLESLFGGRRHG
jgi:hypothetical protein